MKIRKVSEFEDHSEFIGSFDGPYTGAIDKALEASGGLCKS